MGIAEFLTFVLLMIKLFGTTSLTWLHVFLPMIIIYGVMLSSFIIYITIGITLVVRDELIKKLS